MAVMKLDQVLAGEADWPRFVGYQSGRSEEEMAEFREETTMKPANVSAPKETTPPEKEMEAGS